MFAVRAARSDAPTEFISRRCPRMFHVQYIEAKGTGLLALFRHRRYRRYATGTVPPLSSVSSFELRIVTSSFLIWGDKDFQVPVHSLRRVQFEEAVSVFREMNSILSENIELGYSCIFVNRER